MSLVSSLCPDDLLARARTGSISLAESEALRNHLGQCPTCRIAMQMGRDFDRALSPRSRDDELARRVAAVAAAASAERQVKPLRRWAGAVAAMVLVGSTAMAAATPQLRARARSWLGYAPAAGGPDRVRQFSARPGATARMPEPPLPPPALAPEPQRIQLIQQPIQPKPRSVLASRTEAERPRRAEPADREQRPSADAPSAEVLFSLANSRRRAGDQPGAEQLYRELETRYPGSVEAVVSHVSLGRLLLDRHHDASAALRHFDSYLTQHAQTALAEEALFGRATALLQLGRRDDERATWQQLLAEYPASVYAKRARARLQDPR